MIVSTGNYPINLALGNIKPIYKGKGSDRNVANYRPILLKNSVEKIVDGFLFGDIFVKILGDIF